MTGFQSVARSSQCWLWLLLLMVLSLSIFGPAPVAAAPIVTAHTPADGATMVPVDTAVTATFSEPLDPATVTSGSVTLSQSVRISAVAAGNGYTAVLRDNGTVSSWGYNGFGQTSVPAGLGGVTAIASGYSHTLALKHDGTIIAWGENGSGQTTVPADLAGVTAVAAGAFHSLAITSDGRVTAWGYNLQGQTTVPGGLTGVIGIAAGSYHSLALQSDGTVTAWGDNRYGQTTVPAGLAGVVAVAAGNNFSLALKDDGTVVAWGDNRYGQTAVPDGLAGVVAMATKLDFSLALKKDGTVVAWGDNSQGQASVPADLNGITAIAVGYYHAVALKKDGTLVLWGSNTGNESTLPAALTGVTAVAAGYHHTVALQSDGTLSAWGYNNNGQATVPAGLSGVISQAAGSTHTLAVNAAGIVTAWGSNYYGETSVPADLAGVIAVAAGDNHSVALKNDGTVVAWGLDSYGQATVPGDVANVVQIAAGTVHTLALKQGGTVTGWGSNAYNAATPPVGLSGVIAIAAGGKHSVALKSDGSVIAWGDNSRGQSTVPQDLANVIAIAAGTTHTVALKNDGTVVAWGDNTYGQTAVPARLAGVVAIDAGNNFTIAVKNDGTLVGWGYNSYGQATAPQDPYGQKIEAAVSYSTAGDSATLTPAAALPLGKTLTAVVNRGVRSLDGTHPAAAYSWSFTTVDTTPPVTTVFPAGGIYSSPQTVTLVANEPATIYYTTNGATPTTASPVYAGPLTIAVTTTVQFFARDTTGNSETAQTATYTMVADALPPVTSASPPGGSYTAPQSVTLTANEPATIYYTTNGTMPTTASSVYTGTIPIPVTTTLRFFARDTAGNSETVKTANYIINLDTTPPVTSASPPGGSYTGPQSVTLTANESATIYYTTNGAMPTTASSVYTGTIPIPVTTTLRFFARDTAGNSEAVKTASYTINIDTTPPVTGASPPGGTYTAPQSVTLTANEPATIYYTTNGAAPTTASPVYAGPIPIPVTTTLKFFARDTAGNSEAAKTVAYLIKANQVITFTLLPAARVYGDQPFALNATASSGLPISYTSSNPAVATVSGSTVTIIGAGITTITATQEGNAFYNPAAAVNRLLVVNKAVLTVRAGAATRVYGAANPVFGVTYSGFVNNETQTVVTGAPLLSCAATVTSPVGTYPVTVAAGTLAAANYSFSLVNGSLTVTKASQTISFGTLTAKTYGDAAATLSATASSGLAVSYSSSNTAVATVNGSLLTSVGAGTTVITASQAGDGNYEPALSVDQPLTINKATATVILGNLSTAYDGTPKAVTATTVPAGLNVNFTYNSAVTAPTAVGNYNVVATVSDPNYQGSAAGTLVIAKGDQTISFGALPVKTYGDPAFTLAATASSGLPVSYMSSNSAVAVVSGNSVTIVGAGTATITANQAGDGNYNAAPAVAQTLTVNKAPATVTFGELTFTYDGNPKPVTVTTVPAGLAVTITYNNSTTAPTNVGSYTVVATVNDANYQGSATATEVIAKRNQTITFEPLAPKTYGDPAFTLAATASSNLAVTYTSSNPAVATISTKGKTATVTIVGAGTTVITAYQDGNGNYNDAPPVANTLVVNKAFASVTLGNLTTTTYDGTARTATAVTSPPGLTVIITYNGSTAPPSAAGTYSVSGTIDSANYQGSSASGTLIINKAVGAVTLGNLSATYNGTPRSATATTTPAGLTVAVTYSGSPTAPTAAGSYNIVATVSDTNFQGSASGILTIARAGQTISFTPLPAKTVGDAPFTLNATASSGLAVSYSSSNPAVATISGSTVTIVGAGVATITASQVGSDNYSAAPIATQNLTVNAAPVGTGKMAITIGGATSYYDTLAAAFGALPTGSTVTVKLQAVTFAEPLTISSSGTTVSLLGGYDSGFGSAIGMSAIQGNLVIGQGAVIVDRLVIL